MGDRMNNFDKGFELIQDLVKKRWVPEILNSIKNGNHSYTDILNSIEYLSHTELIRKLKIMEEYGVIRKEEKGVNSCYYTEDLGDDLNHIFLHFSELGQRYFN